MNQKNMPEPVQYIVGLVKGADANACKSDLERIAADNGITDGLGLSISQVTPKRFYLFGMTTQQAYEKLFSCSISQQTRTINVSGPSVTPKRVTEWVEITKAVAPKGIESYVSFIELNSPRYTC